MDAFISNLESWIFIAEWKHAVEEKVVSINPGKCFSRIVHDTVSLIMLHYMQTHADLDNKPNKLENSVWQSINSKFMKQFKVV